MRQLEDQKSLGGGLHPRSKQRDQLAREPQPVVSVLQRGKRGAGRSRSPSAHVSAGSTPHTWSLPQRDPGKEGEEIENRQLINNPARGGYLLCAQPPSVCSQRLRSVFSFFSQASAPLRFRCSARRRWSRPAHRPIRGRCNSSPTPVMKPRPTTSAESRFRIRATA